MKNNTYYFCGTDTNVGKTFVLAAILSHLHHKKKKFQFFKPIESGAKFSLQTGRLLSSDSKTLCQAVGNRVQPHDVNFHCFAEPVAPALAAQIHQQKIDLKKIAQHIAAQKQKDHVVFVEGAGGLLAPLSEKKTNLDFIHYLGAKVILIGRLGLGTVNHTLLTYYHLKNFGVEVVGVILNQTHPKNDLAIQTNAQVLRSFGLPIWGVMPYQLNQKKSPKPPVILPPAISKKILQLFK